MSERKKIALFFGSFNPLHIGHMILANYLVEFTNCDQLWFVISPQNPHKERAGLLDATHRYAIVERAVYDDNRFKVSKIEFSMPVPSFTCDTMVRLVEKYPDYDFSLLIGEDNLKNFHKWKNAAYMVENFHFYVYPRAGSAESDWLNHTSFTKINAPEIEISSSFIRKAIKEKKDVSWYMPEKAWQYIDEMNFYK